MFLISKKLEAVLASGSTDNRRPQLGRGNESNIKGLYVIGDLAGAPVIKLAMAQGVEVIDYIAQLPDMQDRGADPEMLDVAVIGAGAAGLNAALAAQDRGMRFVVLEKNKIANTIEDFPEGKWVYAEPDSSPPKGKLWLDGARKEDLIERWNQIVHENNLEVRTEESLTSLDKQSDGSFVLTTAKAQYRARKVVLATGQRGNPRKLGVLGEDRERVYHRLYSPRKYQDKDILVVGGGNSAVEAALTLSEANRVILSYRQGEFGRVFKDNMNKLDAAIADKRVEVVFHSQVKEFGAGESTLSIDRGGHQEERSVRSDYAFVLVGAQLPVKFLRDLGIRLENEWTGVPWRALALTVTTFLGWLLYGRSTEGGEALGLWPAREIPSWLGFAESALTIPVPEVPSAVGLLLALGSVAALITTGVRGDRWSWLGLSAWLWYSVYGIKVGGASDELWPYTGWAYNAMTFFERPWSFWYTVIYTLLMTFFGIKAVKRWGFDRKDRFQIWRYASLLSFQWLLFFIVPEFLFQWALEYEAFGEQLSNDPQFRDQAWRSYGLVYAWPLFFYTWFWDPHMVWVVWGVALTFVIIPILVLFQGKRYCSWICGCGGLAETFGDRWRHLAAKGKTAVRLEWMSWVVLIAAFVFTLMMLFKDLVALMPWLPFDESSGESLKEPTETAFKWYALYVDVWLVGILPVTVYPFLGGKVWCRYWCPLAKMMGLFSSLYVKLGISRFRIEANDKCIGCNECSRNCQVGIPVMEYALKQIPLDNETSSCIGCGICVSACPMDTLSFGKGPNSKAAGPYKIKMPSGDMKS